jgi:hypothetical protein
MLYEKLSSSNSIKEKAFFIMEHYNSRRLNSSLEPIWIHKAYEYVQQYLDDKLDQSLSKPFYEVVNSHCLKDGTEVPSFPNKPSSPVRIMHEGWKIGTPTWIFMGRNESGAVTELPNGWVVVKRVVPTSFQKLFDPDIPLQIYFAYNINDQMGLGADTANSIGPSLDFDELCLEIEKQSSLTR